jgi:hypothetical protein
MKHTTVRLEIVNKFQDGEGIGAPAIVPELSSLRQMTTITFEPSCINGMPVQAPVRLRIVFPSSPSGLVVAASSALGELAGTIVGRLKLPIPIPTSAAPAAIDTPARIGTTNDEA